MEENMKIYGFDCDVEIGTGRIDVTEKFTKVLDMIGEKTIDTVMLDHFPELETKPGKERFRVIVYA